MRRAAARHTRWRITVHRVSRMFGAVVNDDRRAVVVSTEIESGAGILLHVDLVGETPHFSAHAFAVGSGRFDILGHRAATADFGFGMRHRKPPDLACDLA